MQQLALRLGIHQRHVNAAPDAVRFYVATGWHRFAWDASEPLGLSADRIQMRKRLRP